MQTKITTRTVTALATGAYMRDTEIPGFLARRLPSGKVSFGYQYKINGKRSFASLGMWGVRTADEARQECRKLAGEVASKNDPAEARRVQAARSENSVARVLDRWLVEYVDRKELRSAPIIKAQLDRYVRPKIGDVVVYDLKRSEITAALADIASERVGDLVLGHLRCAFAWWALRDDNFTSPIVRGMRGRPKTRERVLDDEELCDLWQALDAIERDKPESLVTPYFRLLLLTACRRGEVAGMREGEINRRSAPPVWTIPANRYKTKRDHAVPLSPTLLAIIPKSDRREFMFGDKRHGYAWLKLAVDQAITAVRERDGRPAMPRWTIHDIRRTAATLMARAGVRPDVVERVLGHVVGSHVSRIYNRHDHETEKFEALAKLAEIVNRITNPRFNVVPFTAGVSMLTPRVVA